jgi:alanyl-tRNA synthetase
VSEVANERAVIPGGAKTDRLYYTDAYATSFEASVTAIGEVNGHPALALARTLFYPTSGGQPNDTGTLAGQAVLDVVAQGDVIWHLLDGAPAGQVGDMVAGSVDWPRRYDHMQQHSSQHLLSQVFARLFEYETVAVHFGATEATLDLDAAVVEPGQLAAAERLANELAYQALPITAYFVTDAEIGSLPLRRPPKVTGQIRIVEIAGYDYSACGGTHVRSTTEVAPVKILRQERRRGQTRITFKAGLRAVQDYAEKHRLLVEAAAIFNNEITAVPGLVQRTLDQAQALQRQVDTLTGQLLAHEIGGLMAAATTAGAVHVIRQLYGDRTPDALKQTAMLLREQASTVALLGTTAGGKLTLIFSRSDDVDLHMGNLLRDTLKAFGGSGGGRPEIAQGGVGDMTLGARVLDYAQEHLV